MSMITWAEEKMKKFKWYDVKLAQLTAIFFVLALIAGWPAFLEAVLKVDWYWYLVVCILFGAPLVKRVFVD